MADETAEQVPNLPTGRPLPFAHDPELLSLRDGECPVRRVRTATGDQAWMTTRHAGVREVYTNGQLGRTHPDPASAARLCDHPVLAGPSDLYSHAAEYEQHRYVRQLLGSYFSARRIRDLQPYVAEVGEELLDAMAKRTPPVDLHQALSYPLPLRVLCELLGVPFEDRELFQDMVFRMGDLNDSSVAAAGHQELFDYLHRTVRRFRRDPSGESVLAGLCAEGLDDEQVAGFASLLLFAGHDSTAFHIDAGVLLLLRDADQFRRLSQDPGLVDGAVEEVLRTAGRDAMGFLRYAREPIDLSGVALDVGDAVVPQLSLANFDDEVFVDPARFDITRWPNPHLTFGHGAWHCLGAPLARAVLRTAFAALATRFPGLRVAVSSEQLRQCDSGFVELPVTW